MNLRQNPASSKRLTTFLLLTLGFSSIFWYLIGSAGSLGANGGALRSGAHVVAGTGGAAHHPDLPGELSRARLGMGARPATRSQATCCLWDMQRLSMCRCGCSGSAA